ncbi:hypothetical protein [Photobacterium profundum]|uniref:Uncharacterized protein n=1 Tax=Photobacterium profundum (strain SS9) TaxID=298386 RepID=Q6LHC8_PHOPR|nr:hypothetical protein [Photobacterium profundum]CAG23302.1 hypothetical protein PBPRB1436 [Photobacterium profundum SS9]
MKNYYSLLTFNNVTWSVQFGDYDKDVVRQEIIDSYSHYKKKNVIIIKSKDDRYSVDEEVAKLNKVTYSIYYFDEGINKHVDSLERLEELADKATRSNEDFSLYKYEFGIKSPFILKSDVDAVKTCAEYVKDGGLRSLAQLEEISGIQVRTLRNWYGDESKRFVLDAIIEKASRSLHSENISV